MLAVGRKRRRELARAKAPTSPTGSQAYDWAKEFDVHIGDQIAKGQLDLLQNFLKLGEVAKMAHPTGV